MYDDNQYSPMVPAQQGYAPQNGAMPQPAYQPGYAGQPDMPQQQPYGPQMGPQAQAGMMPPNAEPLNQLLTAATPLLTLITQIKHTVDQKNVPALRAKIIEEIKTLEQQLMKANYPMRTIVAARYCLCTAIDEAVLSRPWGTGSVWVQESLLSAFHKETWGGERFYIILDNMAKEPRKNIDFLEFAYVLLSLGFEGKYFEKNVTVREEIRNRIFYRIRHSRNKPNRILSAIFRDELDDTKPKSKKRQIKRITLATVVTLAVIGLVFNIMVHNKAEPVLKKLEGIATVSPITSFSEVINRPIIERGVNQ